MSKLLIDSKLLERLQERLDPHIDARDWGMVCDTFRATHPAPASVGGEKMRERFSQIEDEIMAGKHTASSVFTQMRTAALYMAATVPATDYAALEAECERLREHAAMFVWLRDKCHLFEHYRAMTWRPDAFEKEVREAMAKDAALSAKP